ncbi:uncharacterized protein C8R40DRAFT_1071667 [Lentinula edodes]|uniref:uncharacterized protein n=1 Tax=Lentinula edodes TaxID=5353 RepID=UPI001E8DFFD1|nr:uncharacterized protein C8R40DRAFT_1071667 [Lentinula edodes]KAH7872434.1 hypothetical protein C8R40DRAFT_1071667 [Lentinula edodes]
MTIKKSVRRRFIRSIASPPPVIDASLPLSPEVIEALDALHLMTRSLSEISSFQSRLCIIEPNWSCIWLWLKALLRPLDAFHDGQSRIKSPESLEILGKIWVFSFALRWPLPVHQATTQFLVIFSQIIDGSRIVSTWSTAVAESPRWSVSSNPNSQSLMGNQGLILAATVMFIQPLPVIQEVDVILSYIRRLWNRCLDGMLFSKNNDIGINLLLSFEYLARFFLRLISGGSKWIVKALDYGLLCLLVKTLTSGSLPTLCHTTNSIHTVLEDIIHQLLLNVIFIPVVRRVRRNLSKVRIQGLEDYLGVGRLRKLWSICFEKSIETVCSNESCPGNPSPGVRSKLCGACRATAYCSKSCQKQDWQAGHKKSCKKQFSKVAAFLYLNTLTSSRIVIEFDLTTYPWEWTVLDQVSSSKLSSLFADFPNEQDTVIGLRSSSGLPFDFVRPCSQTRVQQCIVYEIRRWPTVQRGTDDDQRVSYGGRVFTQLYHTLLQ